MLRYPVQGAELVAVGIAQIGDIEFHPAAFAYPRRLLAGFSAMGDTCRVKRVGGFRRIRGKADGAAIGVARRLAVDRQCHREGAGLGSIENAMVVDPSGWN